jgi:LPXTG-motif cell wall-anchored protein
MKEITVTAAAARPASLPRTGQATAGATLLVFFALAFFGLGVWARRQRSE